MKKQSNKKLVYNMYQKPEVILTTEGPIVFQTSFDFASADLLYFEKCVLVIVYSGKHIPLTKRFALITLIFLWHFAVKKIQAVSHSVT